jgi:hypothetical protein
MKLGVMQGRLSVPVNGHIQQFPKNWEQEFDHVKKIGLIGIEWLVTNEHYVNNPIVCSSAIKTYPVISVCLDNLVDEKIDNFDFLYSVISSCRKTGVKQFTIPLLESSSMENKKRRDSFCKNINYLSKIFHDCIFSFEAELGISELDEILSGSDNFCVTYDTGNTTSYGLDHESYIKHYKSKINNVHLKDRTIDATTVDPFTGDTDFALIFKCLKDIKYDGTFVIQTARGKTGDEVQTITKHAKLFKDLYDV